MIAPIDAWIWSMIFSFWALIIGVCIALWFTACLFRGRF